jgi:allantoate deiminase
MIPITIDEDVAERYVLDFARFGAFGDTGVWRTVYSPEWVAAADQYAAWCVDAGLDVSRDAVGNVYGRLAGSEPGPSIVTGSHIDTQRPGGRYDGALGALAGLIALKTLAATFGRPRRTLEALALCEEEGSRFPSANFWGSRAITGRIHAGDAERLVGYEGETMAEAMAAVGLDPTRIAQARRSDINSFVELHIEQGPVLEQADCPVAIVDAITGLRHYWVTLTGEQNHAGAFPMDLRRDPMGGFAEIASGVLNTAHRMGRPSVTTVGRVIADPNYPAVVPRSVAFTIDARHPDPAQRALLYARHEALIREVAARRSLDVEIKQLIEHAPCICDPSLVSLFQDDARDQGVPFLTMPSGAGHDSQQMAEIAKVVMIFVRSAGGRSHTPEEFSSVPDIIAGIRTLAAGLHQLAY